MAPLIAAATIQVWLEYSQNFFTGLQRKLA
jgi:hypothetical protein